MGTEIVGSWGQWDAGDDGYREEDGVQGWGRGLSNGGEKQTFLDPEH